MRRCHLSRAQRMGGAPVWHSPRRGARDAYAKLVRFAGSPMHVRAAAADLTPWLCVLGVVDPIPLTAHCRLTQGDDPGMPKRMAFWHVLPSTSEQRIHRGDKHLTTVPAPTRRRRRRRLCRHLTASLMACMRRSLFRRIAIAHMQSVKAAGGPLSCSTTRQQWQRCCLVRLRRSTSTATC
jgi:hypothetical protein